ncbi:hypothetical protein GCM10009554_27620 [Kribbella koreensis]|uniref:Uncharacterized protein n=2 Tax=Kribbella TaxID=182639 RepID=A0ABP6W6R2_9ACTN
MSGWDDAFAQTGSLKLPVVGGSMTAGVVNSRIRVSSDGYEWTTQTHATVNLPTSSQICDSLDTRIKACRR